MRLLRRIPKRGFKNPVRKEFLPVNVSDLDCFSEGTDVTPVEMKAKGLANGAAYGIKILGRGELAKKLVVKAHAFSASAKEKIEAAGGTCEVVAPR